MRKKTGSIQNRGTSWRIAYYDANHIRQYESWPTEDDAIRELAQRLHELAQGIPVSSKPHTVLFRELCKDVITDYRLNQFRSIDDIEARYRLHILPILGERRAAQITTSMVRSYADMRLTEGAKPGTVNRELEAVRHAFKLAIKGKKVLTEPHIPLLKENNVRSGFFTRSEVDTLCRHLKAPYDSFVLFAFLTGWRKDEIRNLQWRNVDFQAGEIRLDAGTTKNGEARVFPMTDELRRLLSKLSTLAKTAKRPGVISPAVPIQRVTALANYVFSVSGKPVLEFRKSWTSANRKAGLPCLIDEKTGKTIRAVRIFHDLRRSAARARQQEGFTEGQIMRMMGWKSRSVFERYAIVTDADIREKFTAIGAANGAKGRHPTGGNQ